jgi:hypothetical protein
MPLLLGPDLWSMSRDEEGHREYKVRLKVRGDTTLDGPATILFFTPGIPLPYSWWLLGTDADLFAWCKWDADVQRVSGPANETGLDWWVSLTFTTKPPKEGRCRDQQVEDPLLEPIKLSGSGIKYTEEQVRDEFGNLIVNSAWEQIRGPQVEFDRSRSRVHIEMNVPLLLYDYVMSFMDVLNNDVLWDMPKRCVKFSDFSWERKYWGQCEIYYTWKMDFDLRASDTVTGIAGFDRVQTDEGTKVLFGHWGPPTPAGPLGAPTSSWVLDLIPATGQLPNPNNPQHFMRYQGRTGNTERVVLNGCGVPASDTASSPPAMGYLALPFNAEVDLFWGNPIPICDSFNIYRGLSSGSLGQIATGVTGLEYFDTASLVNGTTYFYRIVPVKDGSEVTANQSDIFFAIPTATAAALFLYATGGPGNLITRYYPDDDLTQLGIPTVLDTNSFFIGASGGSGEI